MKLRIPLVAMVALGLTFGACNDESIAPIDVASGGGRGGAQVLHTISTRLPGDQREDATAALTRDAFRRENRFLDAVDPGYLFRSTRIDEAAIESGAWSSDELYQIGGQLFNFTFTEEVGYGGKDLPAYGRFQTGRRGGPDAPRCATCHWRGGPAGAGDAADNAYLDGDGSSQSSALARNPIALAGAGLVEIVAAEMSAELEGVRSSLANQASSSGKPARGDLIAKGISFGRLTVKPDGSVDSSEVSGIDADLVVKPFGWKGNVATVRDAVEDELLLHHGMESDHLVAEGKPERVGPFGGVDPDGDHVTSEITEGQVTALTLFVAMQEAPIESTPVSSEETLLAAKGRAFMKSLGCTSCHVSSLPLSATTFTLPSRGGGAAIKVDLARDGAEPRIAPDAQSGAFRVFLFSDLKRHDVGKDLAEARADRGAPAAQFLTRPLWGVARSRPYLHDARAALLEDAILLHGGEAQKARDGYAALGDVDRGAVRLMLTTLTRAPRMVTQ
jgi:di-heme oxidoreductase (putative peroxidase)